MYRRCLKKIIIGWLFLILLVAFLGKISVAAPKAGETSADFLLINVGARAAGMGGAYTAVTEGANSTFWNPAGLTYVENDEVIIGYFSWYQDIKMNHASYAHNMNEKLTLAASINYLNYGHIDGRDINGITTGEISAYDFSGGISLGIRVRPEFSLGLTAKFINQHLDDLNGSTFAFDLGARYKIGIFNLAAVATNIGPKMKFDQVSENIPSSFRFGASVAPFHENLLTAIEFEKRIYGGNVIRHGLEYSFAGQYFIRGGYNYYPDSDDRIFGTGFAVGAGVRFNQFEVDYAYTPSEHYSSEDLHRFSLIFKFGE